MGSIWGELRRRNVAKVGAAYAIVSWLLVEIIVSIEAPLNLPDWTDTLVIVLLAVGFVVALFFAWAYELTPEGVKRTKSVPLSESITKVTGRKLDFVIIGLLVLAVGFMFVDNYVRQGERPAETATMIAEAEVLPNSVAVLPFENLSPNADDAYFAAGLHDEVLNQLAKLSSLSVISRTSVSRYADSGLSIPEIARELNVQAVMEGTVRYADGRVRITTQLIDAETDEHLWSDTYDREFADIFAIESDIATSIANALEAEFSDEEQESIEQVPTSSPEAYALYLRALSTAPLVVTTPSELALAISDLDRATELDPEFARAYAYKALLLSNRGRGRPDVDAWATIAEDAARHALEIDPDLAWAHVALGDVHHSNWRAGDAQAAFELAYRLNPNDIHVLGSFTFFKRDTAQLQDALSQARRLVELDPTGQLYSHYLLGLVQFSARDYETAVASFRRSLEFNPGSANALMHIGRIEAAQGNRAEAITALQTAEQLFQGQNFPPGWVALTAHAYAQAGRADDARRLIAELERREQAGPVNHGDWAVAAITIGDYEEATRRVGLAIDARELSPGPLQTIKMNLYRDPVLDEPHWQGLRAQIFGL